jgi:hypothetical protein
MRTGRHVIVLADRYVVRQLDEIHRFEYSESLPDGQAELLEILGVHGHEKITGNSIIYTCRQGLEPVDAATRAHREWTRRTADSRGC